MRDARRLSITSCAILILLLGGCGPFNSVTIGKRNGPVVASGGGSRNGPPPHAPAHGHRHKQKHRGGDMELAFDSGLGVYVVLDVPDRYYWNGYYLRVDGNQWYASTEIDGRWSARTADSLPASLTSQKSQKKAKKRKSKKSAPAKGRW